MKIVEEFYTLQGEGKFLGVPSYFVRTTGCNLRCVWKNPDNSVTLCDTPYTSFRPEKGYAVTAVDILRKMQSLPTNHIVLTGGEPTIQPDAEEIVQYLGLKGFQVTVETNGTKFMDAPKAFMSISPKLKSSYGAQPGTEEHKLHTANNHFVFVLQQYTQKNDYQVKFVYNEPEDFKQITQLQRQLDIPQTNVYVMPQGVSQVQFQERQKQLFNLCMEAGYNYTPRMHIDIFGNKRGI